MLIPPLHQIHSRDEYRPPPLPNWRDTSRGLLILSIVACAFFLQSDLFRPPIPESQVSWGSEPQAILAAETALIGPENLSANWPNAELEQGKEIDLCGTASEVAQAQIGGARSVTFGTREGNYAGFFDAMIHARFPQYLRNSVFVYSDDQSTDQALGNVMITWLGCRERQVGRALFGDEVQGDDNPVEGVTRMTPMFRQRGARTEVYGILMDTGPYDKTAYGIAWVRVGKMISVLEIAWNQYEWIDLASYMTAVAAAKLQAASRLLPATEAKG